MNKNIYDKVKQVNLMVYFEFFDINMFLKCGNGFINIGGERNPAMQCPYCNKKTCFNCKKQVIFVLKNEERTKNLALFLV